MLGDSAGAKSRVLVRVRQAEGIGQLYRDTNPYKRKLLMLLVGEVTSGKGQGKARGANGHEVSTTKEK